MLAAQRYEDGEPVNLGVGREITIRELTETIARLTGFQGEIRWDATKPDGQPRRALDTSRARAEFSFTAGISFEEGLRNTVRWYEAWRSLGGSRRKRCPGDGLRSRTASNAAPATLDVVIVNWNGGDDVLRAARWRLTSGPRRSSLTTDPRTGRRTDWNSHCRGSSSFGWATTLASQGHAMSGSGPAAVSTCCS